MNYKSMSKILIIIIGSKQKLATISRNELMLHLNNETIKHINSMPYLGVLLDETLSWNGHIDNVSKKLGQRIGMLSCLKSILPKESLITIYNSIILPTIDYAIPVWGWSSQRNINEIQRYQNRVARVITGDFSWEKCGLDIASSLGWLNVRQRASYMTIVLTYKCNFDKSPVYLRNLLSYTYDCHDRKTRNASNHSFHIPKVNCEKFRESYCYQAPKNWNALSSEIKASRSINQFKYLIKCYLASKS